MHFPQLTSGSICELPVIRSAEARTVVNLSRDGGTIRMGDAAGGTVRWKLQYSSLLPSEWDSIRQLFEQAEGRLNSFTFLDPSSNLLTWSEDWTKPSWSVDPLLAIAAGAADPFGGTNGLRITNSAQAAQRITQTIDVPGGLTYCFSVYLRCDVGAGVTLYRAAGGDESRTNQQIGTSWTRVMEVSAINSSQDEASFGIELPAGVQVEAFGAQVEGQPAAGPYKRTTDRSGVYSKTRFDMDSLLAIMDAPDRYSCTITLASVLEP